MGMISENRGFWLKRGLFGRNRRKLGDFELWNCRIRSGNHGWSW